MLTNTATQSQANQSSARCNAAGLSRAVTVHRAHFTVDFVIAIRFAKDGIRICLHRLFCVRAARKQRPGQNENYKCLRKHVSRSRSSSYASQTGSEIADSGRRRLSPLPAFNCAAAVKWINEEESMIKRIGLVWQ